MQTKTGRASRETSQLPSTQENVPEEFLRFYKQPLQVGVDVRCLSIDKKKKYGQIQKQSTEASGRG